MQLPLGILTFRRHQPLLIMDRNEFLRKSLGLIVIAPLVNYIKEPLENRFRFYSPG